ncbi:hypothetical protein [Ornithinibacillus sp. FSL M8-0202]|uniref:hypothetical protein n=1 Tax=Ornithinibacillus sp. FSL M8-0202 TaxID=2921616 RepID=UPI0030D04FD4
MNAAVLFWELLLETESLFIAKTRKTSVQIRAADFIKKTKLLKSSKIPLFSGLPAGVIPALRHALPGAVVADSVNEMEKIVIDDNNEMVAFITSFTSFKWEIKNPKKSRIKMHKIHFS